jgi:hypothetical protein
MYVLKQTAEAELSNMNTKIVKIDPKIYSQGEIPDSPGGFRYKRAG